ncbi:hypothetical protein ACFL2U_02860 [Patescibacteria group bacterium]
MMNNISKIYLACLIITSILLGGVFVAQSAGFFSYEDGDKFILWANMRMVGDGLRLSNLGIDEPGRAPGGDISITGKDIQLRGFMGFNCINYPSQITCDTTLGNIGGRTFLRVDRVGHRLNLSTLELAAEDKAIDLVGDSIRLGGNIILNGHLSMVNETGWSFPSVGYSVFTPNLRVMSITNNPDLGSSLKVPDIKFVQGGIFDPQRIIEIDLFE